MNRETNPSLVREKCTFLNHSIGMAEKLPSLDRRIDAQQRWSLEWRDLFNRCGNSIVRIQNGSFEEQTKSFFEDKQFFHRACVPLRLEHVQIGHSWREKDAFFYTWLASMIFITVSMAAKRNGIVWWRQKGKIFGRTWAKDNLNLKDREDQALLSEVIVSLLGWIGWEQFRQKIHDRTSGCVQVIHHVQQGNQFTNQTRCTIKNDLESASRSPDERQRVQAYGFILSDQRE